MTRAARRTLAAGFATSMALAAIFPVYHGSTWFWRTLGAVLAVTVAGLLTRAVRLPALLQPVVELLALGGYLLVTFAHETFAHGLPTSATFDVVHRLAQAGQADIDKYGPPVPVSPGLVLLTAGGVGAVAVAVDLLAVVLDRPAVAGLPLLVLFAVPSAVLPGGLGGTAFVIGATGWLVLLLEEGSERVSRWGTPMRAPSRSITEESSLGRVGRRVGAAALGLAVVVPAMVPGLDHRLVHGSGGVGPGGDGPSSAVTYNPLTTLQAQLTLPEPQQLFVYTTTDPTPDYVRMTTLDTYTGGGWASSKLEADRDDARVQKGIAAPAGEDVDAPHQDVTMRIAVDGDHLAVHWLPVPYGPRKIENIEGTWLWDEVSQTVFSASRTTRRLAPYTVEARRMLPSRGALLDAATRETNSTVAEEYGGDLDVAPSVRALAQRVVRKAKTPYDRAVAIQRYFTNPLNGFVYDTDPSRPGPGVDPLQAFLDGKHGFCEQYATAMAVLLRLAGLPSRVAVGFTPGQAVPREKGTYSVTTSDAHAWPEAWFQGAGWVRFEPTPAASGATTPDYTLPPQPVSGPAGTPSTGPTASPRPNDGGRGGQDPADLLRDPGSTTPLGAARGHTGRWVSLGVLLLVVLLAPFVTTLLRRRWRAARMDPLVAWEQLRDDAADVGAPWLPTDSPAAAARRLQPVLDPPAREALGRLATAAELTRYAPPGRAADLLDGLVADLATVRRSLRASAPRSVRWRAVLMAPSTLQWAAHQAAERVADVLDVTDRVVSAVFRPARRLLRIRA